MLWLPSTRSLLCDELYFDVVLLTHTNYNCYKIITYLLIYALSTQQPTYPLNSVTVHYLVLLINYKSLQTTNSLHPLTIHILNCL